MTLRALPKRTQSGVIVAHSYRDYIITVTEADQRKARELRSMLRNYRGTEVLPGVFRVTLSQPQHRVLVSNVDQLGGALRFTDSQRQAHRRAAPVLQHA